MKKLYVIIFIISSFLLSCSEKSEKHSDPVTEGRWFTEKQFRLGKQVFISQCASCHGEKAQGIVQDWKQRNPDGSFPPPPLDGSAHAWHHPLEVLVQQVNEGGMKLGGTMPAFGDTLSDEEVIAVIAYFQSYWDEQTYNRWVKMNADY
ncbi:MAG: cytochrome c [Fodinibius sp.]|nr:cytochrome c [Fodinibius sp.]